MNAHTWTAKLLKHWFGIGKKSPIKRRPFSFRPAVEPLEDRLAPAITVAVVGTGGVSDDSGFSAIVSQLNNDTYFNFTATLVSPYQVDTVGELNAYTVVVIGDNGISTNGNQFGAFAPALKTWVLAGGRVVATGWTIYGAGTATGAPVTEINDIIPVNTAGSFGNVGGGSPVVPNGAAHPVTAGVSVFSISSADYIEFPTSTPLVDSGATVLATSSGQPIVVVGSPGLGRAVYLGPIYSGASQYNTAELRSGSADRLLEQAVAWAVGPTLTSVSNNGSVVANAQATVTVNAGNVASFVFDFDNNGTFEVEPQASYQAHHVFSSAGTYVVTAQARDSGNNLATVASLPGLVSWWRGDGNPGDSAAANAGGLVNGTTYATGQVGQAFSFNGVNQSVDFSGRVLAPIGSFAVETWIKTTSLGAFQTIVSEIGNENTAGQYQLRLSNAGRLQFFRRTGSPDQVAFLTTTSSIAPNTWLHVAAVYGGGTDFRLYVNGELAATNFAPTATYGAAATARTRIGVTEGGVEGFNGLIDEVGLYNRALSGQEVRSLYQAGTRGEARNTYLTTSVVVNPAPQVTATTPSLAGGTLTAGTTSMQITFNVPVLNAATASNYELRRAGANGLLGETSGNEDVIVPVSASYNSGTKTATLLFAALPEDVYRLTVKQSITDAAGYALDGDANGVAGGNWVREFVAGGSVAVWGKPPNSVFSLFSPTYFPVSGIIDIADGNSHALFLRSDGTVWASGSNAFGELGDGTFTEHSAPAPVAGLTNVVAIAAGVETSLALRSNGTVWAWGRNLYGQLGDGTTVNRNTPVQVGVITNVVAIATHGYHSLALLSNGTVWAWGYNNSGELGDGTSTNRSTPVQVSGLTGVVAIAGGGIEFSLALKSDGTLRAWGANDYGQLGDGTTTARSTPVSVSGLTGVKGIAAGSAHSLAVLTDGTVRAWGLNNTAQMGDGTAATNRLTPVVVSGLANVRSLSGGQNHSLAVLNDGTAFSWGFNAQGQLGDGTNVQRTTPVQVVGLTDAVKVQAGQVSSFALRGALVQSLSSLAGVNFLVQSNGTGAGQLITGTSNAFDGLNRLQIAGNPFAPTDAPSPSFDNGRTFLTPSQTVAGLSVAREIHVPNTGDQDFARTVDIFYNPSPTTPVITTVKIVGNLGSDAATTSSKPRINGSAPMTPTAAARPRSSITSTGRAASCLALSRSSATTSTGPTTSPFPPIQPCGSPTSRSLTTPGPGPRVTPWHSSPPTPSAARPRRFCRPRN
ncbi:MAG: Ig-like domain-containing protein [Planctomycetes bacterium]|nr:Ig-like domain-containing protein [Planctomycetota bacterium]